MSRVLRRWILGRLISTLAACLGVMQVVIAHWVTVVLAGREGPGPALGLVLAALLVAANLRLVPILRRARRVQGWSRILARTYLSVGIATLLLGAGVLGVWVAALPVGALLSLAGISPETAFQVFRVASIAVVLWIGGMLVWGFTLGHSRFDHTHLRVSLEGLHEDLKGLRIVQLSDLHIGNGLEGSRLEALVARVNSLEADVIALTGDLFDLDPSFVESGARALAGLRARHGVFAVLGNHDAYTGTDHVAGTLGRLAPSVRLLRRDVVRLPVPAPFYVAGIDDPGRRWTADGLDVSDLEALALRRPSDGPVLLLVHRPEAFPRAASLGFPLVLAGHTHGGQLALPVLGDRLNLARIVTRYPRGLFRENGSVLYVNRGAGVAGPAIRIHCPPEIATIELA